MKGLLSNVDITEMNRAKIIFEDWKISCVPAAVARSEAISRNFRKVRPEKAVVVEWAPRPRFLIQGRACEFKSYEISPDGTLT